MFGLAAEARRKEQNVLNCDAERELSSGKREMGVRSTGGNKKAADHAPPLFALTVFPEPFAGFQLPTNWACWFMPASTSFATARKGVSRARWRELPVVVSQCLPEVGGNCGCSAGIPEPLPC
jgi:hypothetical protein